MNDPWAQFPDAPEDEWDQFPDAPPIASGQGPTVPFSGTDERVYSQPDQDHSRAGDFLKPFFSGHNPIAEVHDTFIDPLTDFSTDRSRIDAAKDAAAFTASVPLQMFRAPSLGQMVEGTTGYSGLADSEQSFVEHNPKVIRALGAMGELGAGSAGTLGQGFVRPRAPQQPLSQRKAHQQIGDADAIRARSMVKDMEDIQVQPFAPVVAGARRGDNTPGALSQTLADKPVVGTPLQRGSERLVKEMDAAHEGIRSQYGSSRATTMQEAGAEIRSSLDRFKNDRTVDVKLLEDVKLHNLAKSAPRTSTYKDVQSAKYELAERYLPEDMIGGKAVKGEERMMVGMPSTMAILKNIKRRYGKTINKAQAKNNEATLGDMKDFRDPKWVGSRNIDQSLDAVVSAGGNWRTGLEGMREIRSSIRRVMSSKADSEVNALSRGDLKQLYRAISKDMDDMLKGRASAALQRGDTSRARGYELSRRAYREADAFTARYSEKIELVKDLFRARSDEAVAGKLKTAMMGGTRGNLQRLVAFRKVAPRRIVDEFASAMLVDLGRPGGRAVSGAQDAGFAASRFASQWNNLSPKAKKIIFGHRPKLKAELDKFARVAQSVKDYEALANHSRTGVSNFVSAGIGAVGYGAYTISPGTIGGLITGIMAGRGAAAFLSSPLYVRWLTRSINTPPHMARQVVARLESLVARDRHLPPQAKQAIMLAIRQSMEQTIQEEDTQ